MNVQQLLETLQQNEQPYIYISDVTAKTEYLPEGMSVETNQTDFPTFERIVHADNRPGTLVEMVDNSVSINVAANVCFQPLIHVIIETKEITKRRFHLSIGKQADVRFILHELTLGDYDEMLSVHVLDNARTEVTIIENSETEHNRSYLREITVERDAKLSIAVAALSNGNTISENFTNLVGQNATATSKLITVGSKEQVQHHRVQINNLAPYTNGDILNHGVMKEKASGEFYGVGFIQKGQNGSKNEQESRMMVIDKEARADVHPILLIDEYDVIAGHAGSVGRVSEEALYYLMSRGMNKKEADRLITKGFLTPVLEHIEEKSVREMIEELIERKI